MCAGIGLQIRMVCQCGVWRMFAVPASVTGICVKTNRMCSGQRTGTAKIARKTLAAVEDSILNRTMELCMEAMEWTNGGLDIRNAANGVTAGSIGLFRGACAGGMVGAVVFDVARAIAGGAAAAKLDQH